MIERLGVFSQEKIDLEDRTVFTHEKEVLWKRKKGDIISIRKYSLKALSRIGISFHHEAVSYPSLYEFK